MHNSYFVSSSAVEEDGKLVGIQLWQFEIFQAFYNSPQRIFLIQYFHDIFNFLAPRTTSHCCRRFISKMIKIHNDYMPYRQHFILLNQIALCHERTMVHSLVSCRAVQSVQF